MAGHDLGRFSDRAIRTRGPGPIDNPNVMLATARELLKPARLREALRVVLALPVGAPDHFAPAAARFSAQRVSERRLPLEEAQLVFAALRTLGRRDGHSVTRS